MILGVKNPTISTVAFHDAKVNLDGAVSDYLSATSM